MNRVFPKGLLTDRQKLVFHLHVEEGLSGPEIAARLGISRSAVSWALVDARERVLDYEANGNRSIYLVPTRLRGFLEMADLLKPEALKAAIESGSLHWSEERNRLEWKDYKRERYPWNSDKDVSEWSKYSPRKLGWMSWQQMNELAGLPIPKREGESADEGKVRSASELSDEELLSELERRPHLKCLLAGTGRKR